MATQFMAGNLNVWTSDVPGLATLKEESKNIAQRNQLQLIVLIIIVVIEVAVTVITT